MNPQISTSNTRCQDVPENPFDSTSEECSAAQTIGIIPSEEFGEDDHGHRHHRHDLITLENSAEIRYFLPRSVAEVVKMFHEREQGGREPLCLDLPEGPAALDETPTSEQLGSLVTTVDEGRMLTFRVQVRNGVGSTTVCVVQITEAAAYRLLLRFLLHSPYPRGPAGHMPLVALASRRRHRFVIDESTPRPREYSEEWMRSEWIAWRFRNPPRHPYRYVVWNGVEWVNGPCFHYGHETSDFDGFDRGEGVPWVRTPFDLHPDRGDPSPTLPFDIFESFPGALGAAFRQRVSTPSPLLAIGGTACSVPPSMDTFVDNEDAESTVCVICYCHRATESVACPSNHIVRCYECAHRMAVSEIDFATCPLCRHPL